MTIGRIPSVDGGIQPTIVDAKGDLIVATAADTVSRLAVGSANQVLTVDSSTTTGLKWAAPSAASFVGCNVYNTVGQSIPDNTSTAITFNSEFFDTDGFHSTSTNTSRITIPSGKGGYYLFTSVAEWDGNTNGRRWLHLRKNNSVIVEFETLANVNTASPSGFLYYVTSAAVGDYFEIFAQQNTGGNLNIYFQSDTGTFTCTYLGA